MESKEQSRDLGPIGSEKPITAGVAPSQPPALEADPPSQHTTEGPPAPRVPEQVSPEPVIGDTAIPQHVLPDPQPAADARVDVALEHAWADPEPINTKEVYTGNKYITSQLSVLVSRYVQARGDLLVSVAMVDGADPRTRSYAERVRDSLVAARLELEDENPNLPVAANLLALADRALAWLYPPEVLTQRCNLAKAQLQELRPRPDAVIAELTRKPDDSSHRRQEMVTRHALAEALTRVHEGSETHLIEDDLQVSRLKVVRMYLVLALLLVLAAVPLTTGPETNPFSEQVVWPVVVFDDFPMAFSIVVAALGLAAVGAVGGIISGMFRVRDSRARLAEFRTSMLNFSLRPLAGAVAAVSLYLLLAWEVLNGIAVTSPGVFVLVAFLAGFSERYFLRVIRAEASAPTGSKPAASYA